jgi:N-acetylmuramoyl-L-alanine amidase
MPAVIVEPLFLSNPVEAGIALSRAGRLALAGGLVQALDVYFHSGQAA